MDRKEFEQRFTNYRMHLRAAVHCYLDSVAVYRQIQKLSIDRPADLNQATGFFRIVEEALFTKIVLWADNLFDEKGERGFFNFLTFIEHNRKWLSVDELQLRKEYPDGDSMLQGRIPITFKSIQADRERIQGLNVIASIRTRRDKYHGHFDKNYFFDLQRLSAEAPISWRDLDEAGQVMGDIVNVYSVDFDGNKFSWETPDIDDLDTLLSNARSTKAGSEG